MKKGRIPKYSWIQPSNVASKQKAVEASSNAQTLQVVPRVSLTPTSRVSVPAPFAPMPPPPILWIPWLILHAATFLLTRPWRVIPSTLGSHSTYDLSGYLRVGGITGFACTVTLSNVDALEEDAEECIPARTSSNMGMGPPTLAQQEVPPQWLARLECL
ncbi:UNVERIFIED_CONTAM: hypothetical protein Sangu_3007500 [Sesamum angustifolium]|uniref:Uncharacterized protein n=1 Tax=Sesamum angustifolium TaxID=2727405 RepID=A0AAW2KPD3_9LAMI